ncbi:transcription factor S [Halobacteriales archaeon SW_6_65_15]|jgi:DNA-directed RNA polymerase subunit M|nr:MAG: transcription factor S [Halobacteriales archaeon SW_6_65_15]
MEFCDECGSMMKAEDGMWVCGSCGHEEPKGDSADYTVTEGQEDSEIIETSQGDEESALPTTEAHCPNCGNDRARWYMQQIRAADESETRFFICTECDHKWREDDN